MRINNWVYLVVVCFFFLSLKIFSMMWLQHNINMQLWLHWNIWSFESVIDSLQVKGPECFPLLTNSEFCLLLSYRFYRMSWQGWRSSSQIRWPLTPTDSRILIIGEWYMLCLKVTQSQLPSSACYCRATK